MSISYSIRGHTSGLRGGTQHGMLSHYFVKNSEKLNEIEKHFVRRELDQIRQLFSYIYFYIDLAIIILEQIK